MSQYEIWCYVAGGFNFFSIEIDPSKYLDGLRELILDSLTSNQSGLVVSMGINSRFSKCVIQAFCVVTDINSQVIPIRSL